MTVTYDNNPSINIWRGKYYNLNTEYNYDLIYSCHTLEHYSNPSKVLQYIKSRLNKDGLFYIDVPNNENINHNHNIDEFFYDKHLFYHNDDVLSSYIESLGFELIQKNTTPQNINNEDNNLPLFNQVCSAVFTFKMDVDDSIKPFNCGIGSDDRFVILDSSVKESIKTGISGLSQQHKDWAKQRREKRQQEETEQTKQSAGVTRF